MPRSFAAFVVLLAVVCISLPPADAAEKAKKEPATIYWMSAATQQGGIPGMPGAGSMPGGLFGGGTSGGGQKSLLLQLNSPKPLPDAPKAAHDIPPGQGMGKTLPLLIPRHEKAGAAGSHEEMTMEKPKVRMLIYWGCGEKAGKGQPKVLDTDRMSNIEFAKAMRSRTGSVQHPPMPRNGWIYADWPNRESSVKVSADSSLQGDHFIHGNYIPDIKFQVGGRHDFMAPVEFSSVKGGLGDAITFAWREVPTAIGYFAVAMAHDEKAGETIIWTSSQLPDMGFGLMDYLPTPDVRRFIKDKVVMPQGTASCTVPKGIFGKTEGALLQFIAYGEDLWAGYPPKPKDPKQPWTPIWQAKLRLKSTAMTPLGMGDMEGSARQRPREEQPEQKPDAAGEAVKTLKGLFGL